MKLPTTFQETTVTNDEPLVAEFVRVITENAAPKLKERLEDDPARLAVSIRVNMADTEEATFPLKLVWETHIDEIVAVPPKSHCSVLSAATPSPMARVTLTEPVLGEFVGE